MLQAHFERPKTAERHVAHHAVSGVERILRSGRLTRLVKDKADAVHDARRGTGPFVGQDLDADEVHVLGNAKRFGADRSRDVGACCNDRTG